MTLNPSWKRAQVVSVQDDDGTVIADVENDLRTFSEIEIKHEGFKVKTFSDLSEFGNVSKSSKINGSFTVLKAKEFSANNEAFLVEEDTAPILEEKLASEVETQPKEKEFSVATIKERLRYATKMSTRMRFRRLFLEYKQVVKQMGGAENMDPETLKTLKSLFLADINQIFSGLTQEVLAGKQINTLTGASSISKSLRLSATKLQLPYRLAFQEMQKTGKLTPMRFQKIKEAYTEFAQSMVDEVFGSNPIPAELEQEIKEEENGKA